MELLEQRILTDGKVLPGGILKVDGFLNHQIDPQLLYEMALEFKRLYDGAGIAVEKVFQGGGDMLRSQGLRVESLAKIASMDDHGLKFC